MKFKTWGWNEPLEAFYTEHEAQTALITMKSDLQSSIKEPQQNQNKEIDDHQLVMAILQNVDP